MKEAMGGCASLRAGNANGPFHQEFNDFSGIIPHSAKFSGVYPVATASNVEFSCATAAHGAFIVVAEKGENFSFLRYEQQVVRMDTVSVGEPHRTSK